MMIEYVMLYLPWVAVVAVPTWVFARKRVAWQLADFAVIGIPYIVWQVAFDVFDNGKNLGNLMEGVYVAVVVDVIILARVIIGKRVNQMAAAYMAMGLAIAAAVAFAALMPVWQE
jgi:hypothetical protein